MAADCGCRKCSPPIPTGSGSATQTEPERPHSPNKPRYKFPSNSAVPQTSRICRPHQCRLIRYSRSKELSPSPAVPSNRNIPTPIGQHKKRSRHAQKMYRGIQLIQNYFSFGLLLLFLGKKSNDSSDNNYNNDYNNYDGSGSLLGSSFLGSLLSSSFCGSLSFLSSV